MRNLILLAIATIFLSGCNQPQKAKEEKSTQKGQVNDLVDKSVTLSVEPSVFLLSKLPETITTTMANTTEDTITTGLQYKIESYQNNKWKEISPNDMLFQDLGWQLKPTDTQNFTKKLYKDQIEYKAGKYRIVKHYLKSDYQKTRERFTVYAEFDIEE